MVKLANHIKVSREQGVEAGLEAYLASPASRLHAQWGEIVGAGRRSDESMLKHYCRVFADQLGNTPRRIPAQQERYEGDVQTLAESITEQVQAQVAEMLAKALGGITPEVDDTDDDQEGDLLVTAIMDEYDVPEHTARKMLANGIEPTLDDDEDTHSVRVTESEVRNGVRTSNRPRAPKGAITAGQAWEALGAGDRFKPNDPNVAANNGQLYRLNVSGLLSLRS